MTKARTGQFWAVPFVSKGGRDKPPGQPIVEQIDRSAFSGKYSDMARGNAGAIFVSNWSVLGLSPPSPALPYQHTTQHGIFMTTNQPNMQKKKKNVSCVEAVLHATITTTLDIRNKKTLSHKPTDGCDGYVPGLPSPKAIYMCIHGHAVGKTHAGPLCFEHGMTVH